jgi:hypothetical protein
MTTWTYKTKPKLLTDNLVSYWKLDGDSTDSVGSNDGTDTDIIYAANGGVIDSFTTSPNDSYNVGETNKFCGQSFTTTTDVPLDKCKFNLKYNSTQCTGNATAKIYAITGTPGSTAIPTGAALATSDNFDISAVGNTFAYHEFTFSGVNKITLAATTTYFVVFAYDNGAESNTIEISLLTSGVPTGQNATYSADGSSWSASAYDINFYIYSASYGKINQGAGFNGTTSRIALGTAIACPATISISAWVKKASTGSFKFAIADVNNTSTVGWKFGVNDIEKVFFGWQTSSNDYRQYYSDGTIDTDWHHIVVTQTGTDAPIFYIDGSLSNTNTSSGGDGSKPTAQGTAIGRGGTYDGNYWNGAIDEVGIWSRALTSGEVMRLYNSGSGLSYSSFSSWSNKTKPTTTWTYKTKP